MVCRFVEEQKIRLAQQELAECDAALLTTGEVGHGRLGRRATQSIHRLLELRIDLPRVGVIELFLQIAHFLHELVRVIGGHQLGDFVVALELHHRLAEPVFDVLPDILGVVEDRLLHEDAHRRAGREESLSVTGLIDPRHDLEDARLAGAVGADDTDFRSRIEAHRYVVEDDLVAVRLAHLLHGVDEFRHAGQLIGPEPHRHHRPIRCEHSALTSRASGPDSSPTGPDAAARGYPPPTSTSSATSESDNPNSSLSPSPFASKDPAAPSFS